MSGILYVVATPIGNMEDTTQRAREVLASVDVIAAEDTRTARKLLELLDIPLGERRLVSYFEGNERQRTSQLLEIIEENKSIAIISEAGTPAVSDPGATVVREALERGVRVVPVPGASAAIAAVSVAGLDGDGRFLFMGFPPAKGKDRKRFMERVARSDVATVVYESPHRLTDTLRMLSESCGADRGVVLARELTKMHEEVYRTTVGALLERYESERPRGEFVLVIDPAPQDDTAGRDLPPIESEIARLQDMGLATKTIAAILAPLYGMKKSDVYKMTTNH